MSLCSSLLCQCHIPQCYYKMPPLHSAMVDNTPEQIQFALRMCRLTVIPEKNKGFTGLGEPPTSDTGLIVVPGMVSSAWRCLAAVTSPALQCYGMS